MPIRFSIAAFFSLVWLLGCVETSAVDECAGLTVEECATPDGGTPDGGDPDAGLPEPSPLIVDAAWLREHLDDPDVQLIDTRASGFETSRIPGAIHLRPEELVTTVDGVPAQIKPPLEAQPDLRAAGLRNDAIAVVYGESPEYDPSRVVWSLLYYRHDDVRYLDGGFAAWVDEGGELDTEEPSIEATEYTVMGVDESLRVTGDWVLSQLGAPPYDAAATQLVDARSESEYENGHIPTARSVNWTRNRENGFLLPEADLELLYEGLVPAETTVTYCVSGWRGSFAWLTLTALGYEDVRLYDGSWNEWGNGTFPVVQ